MSEPDDFRNDARADKEHALRTEEEALEKAAKQEYKALYANTTFKLAPDIFVFFDIEQNSEDSEMWGVWERIENDPESDEIVTTRSSEAAAREWIKLQQQFPREYLISRGIHI